jgi:hypothetical protein
MLHEFEEYWLKYRSSNLLNKIFLIKSCGMSADLSTIFALASLFIKKPKIFISELLKNQTKQSLRNSDLSEWISVYIQLKYKGNDEKIKENKIKYIELFDSLTQ